MGLMTKRNKLRGKYMYYIHALKTGKIKQIIALSKLIILFDSLYALVMLKTTYRKRTRRYRFFLQFWHQINLFLF